MTYTPLHSAVATHEEAGSTSSLSLFFDLFDRATGYHWYTSCGHSARVTQLSCDSLLEWIVSVSDDHTARIWHYDSSEAQAWRLVLSTSLDGSPVTSCSLISDVAESCGDGIPASLATKGGSLTDREAEDETRQTAAVTGVDAMLAGYATIMAIVGTNLGNLFFIDLQAMSINAEAQPERVVCRKRPNGSPCAGPVVDICIVGNEKKRSSTGFTVVFADNTGVARVMNTTRCHWPCGGRHVQRLDHDSEKVRVLLTLEDPKLKSKFASCTDTVLRLWHPQDDTASPDVVWTVRLMVEIPLGAKFFCATPRMTSHYGTCSECSRLLMPEAKEWYHNAASGHDLCKQHYKSRRILLGRQPADGYALISHLDNLREEADRYAQEKTVETMIICLDKSQVVAIGPLSKLEASGLSEDQAESVHRFELGRTDIDGLGLDPLNRDAVDIRDGHVVGVWSLSQTASSGQASQVDVNITLMHQEDVTTMRLAHGKASSTLLTGCSDGSIHLWDFAEGVGKGEKLAELRSLKFFDVFVPFVLHFVVMPVQVCIFAFVHCPWVPEIHHIAIFIFKIAVIDFKLVRLFIEISKEDLVYACIQVACVLEALFVLFAVLNVPMRAQRRLQELDESASRPRKLFWKASQKLTKEYMWAFTSLGVVPMAKFMTVAVDCVQHTDDEGMYLFEAPDIQCWQGEHQRLLTVFGPLSLMYLFFCIPYATVAGKCDYVQPSELFRPHLWPGNTARQVFSLHLGPMHVIRDNVFVCLLTELICKVSIPVASAMYRHKPMVRIIFLSSICWIWCIMSFLRPQFVEPTIRKASQAMRFQNAGVMTCGVCSAIAYYSSVSMWPPVHALVSVFSAVAVLTVCALRSLYPVRDRLWFINVKSMHDLDVDIPNDDFGEVADAPR
jgi:WD40 repeat protein